LKHLTADGQDLERFAGLYFSSFIDHFIKKEFETFSRRFFFFVPLHKKGKRVLKHFVTGFCMAVKYLLQSRLVYFIFFSVKK
jgi:hypothetical protein